MHAPDEIIHTLALGDEDRTFAVWATAQRKEGVSDCLARVSWNGGIETQRCIIGKLVQNKGARLGSARLGKLALVKNVF